MEGHLRQPLLVALLLGDIVHGHHRTEHPAVVVDQGLAVDAHLALVPGLRLEDDLDVAQLLTRHGPDQRVLPLGDGRPVGPAEALVGGDGPDRIVVPHRARGAFGRPG